MQHAAGDGQMPLGLETQSRGLACTQVALKIMVCMHDAPMYTLTSFHVHARPFTFSHTNAQNCTFNRTLALHKHIRACVAALHQPLLRVALPSILTCGSAAP